MGGLLQGLLSCFGRGVGLGHRSGRRGGVDPGRHNRFCHLRRAADCTGHHSGVLQFLKCICGLEPAVKTVLIAAFYGVIDHLSPCSIRSALSTIVDLESS